LTRLAAEKSERQEGRNRIDLSARGGQIFRRSRLKPAIPGTPPSGGRSREKGRGGETAKAGARAA